MPITLTQAKFALEHGWKKEDLLKLYGLGGEVTYVTPHFMVLDEKYHVYRMLGLQPLLENRKVEEAIGWGDGSGTNSQNASGIGVVVESPSWDEPRLIHHNIGLGSNNYAEVMAVWRVLMEIPNNQAHITIRTDSAYSIGILTQLNWKMKVNEALVTAIREDLSLRPNVTLKHIKGHNGAYFQEMADALAGVARKYAPQTLYF